MAKNWYILHTYSGYESKIEREIRRLIEINKIDSSVVTDIKVPVEEVVEIKGDRKRTRMNKFLPGYIMIEMDLPELGWKDTCTEIRRINGVTGFVGTKPIERPRPISSQEAKNLLQKSGVIKGDKPVVKHSYNIGDSVKINEGPFATFTGKIEDINTEKDKLRVMVQIFGRETPVEVNFAQVEKAV